MPIYEFRCIQCNECFEILVTSSDEQCEMCCPHCKSENFERVMSSTNYAMGAGGGNQERASTQTRSCSSGSCTTYTIPGCT